MLVAVTGLVLVPTAAAAELSLGAETQLVRVSDDRDSLTFTQVGARAAYAWPSFWSFAIEQSLYVPMRRLDNQASSEAGDPGLNRARAVLVYLPPPAPRAFGVQFHAAVPSGAGATVFERLEPDAGADAVLAMRIGGGGELRLSGGYGYQLANSDYCNEPVGIHTVRVAAAAIIGGDGWMLEPRVDLRHHDRTRERPSADSFGVELRGAMPVGGVAATALVRFGFINEYQSSVRSMSAGVGLTTRFGARGGAPAPDAIAPTPRTAAIPHCN